MGEKAPPLQGRGNADLAACLVVVGWGPSAVRKADGPHPNPSPEGEGFNGTQPPLATPKRIEKGADIAARPQFLVEA